MAYQRTTALPGCRPEKKNGWAEGRFMMNISMKEMDQEMPKYPAKRAMGQIMND